MFDIVDNKPDLYYGSILDIAREKYHAANVDTECVLFRKNCINVVIHIRTWNKDDDTSGEHDRAIPGGKAYIPVQYYKMLIQQLIKVYPNCHILVFTQASYNISELTSFTNVCCHVDTNVFDTFRHMVNANVLVTGRSSFSYLAALYNKNDVVYMPFWHPPLKHWKVLT
jgi:hypothetical protein